MTQNTTLTFLGAAGTVTGSKHLLTVGERRILIDAGLFQGEKDWRLKNWEEFPVDPASISDVILTHAHADHSTYLPALVAHGFSGTIWATKGTVRLAEIVLRDSGRLQEAGAQAANEGGWSKHSPALPLYTTADVEQTIPLFKTVPFDSDVDLGGGVSARYVRAGHILGSASVTVSVDGEPRCVFSGDLGRHDHPILKPREIPTGAPYVVVESTYGDREHPEPQVAHAELALAINRTVERGGKVLMPAFAIDRVEAVLRALTLMFREGRIPNVPVIVDGPMALAALDVYEDTTLGELRDDIAIDDFRGMPRIIETRSSGESKRINNLKGPAIVISSSGMVEGGRILHHLKRGLPDPRNCVVLTGYQAEGTRGRQLEDGVAQVKIEGSYIPVRCEIVRDREFSVHGDASDLLDWLRDLPITPETVYVVHGEPAVAATFAQRIHDELGLIAVVPRYGEVVSLIPGAPDPEDLDLDQIPDPGPSEPDGE